MLQTTALCEVTSAQTGATVVTITFLSIFSLLILVDGILTWRSLVHTLDRKAKFLCC
jgi:hypothetical protein